MRQQKVEKKHIVNIGPQLALRAFELVESSSWDIWIIIIKYYRLYDCVMLDLKSVLQTAGKKTPEPRDSGHESSRLHVPLQGAPASSRSAESALRESRDP